MSQPPATRQPVRRRTSAGWIGSIGATVAIAVVTLGGYAFGGPLPWGAYVYLSDPVPVADGVTIRLGEGWEVAATLTDATGIHIEGPGGDALVMVEPGGGQPVALAERYRTQTLALQASELVPTETKLVDMENGRTGAWFQYWARYDDAATPLEGDVYTMVTPSGTRIVFDGWAPEGGLAVIRDLLFDMTISIEGE
jgi:hypothetical protein